MNYSSREETSVVGGGGGVMNLPKSSTCNNNAEKQLAHCCKYLPQLLQNLTEEKGLVLCKLEGKEKLKYKKKC